MPRKTPRFKGYILLLEKFEKHITKFNPVFNQLDYSLQYILKKKAGADEFEIEVIFRLNSKPSWLVFIDEPRDLSEILSTYILIFGISNCRILMSRPYWFNKDLSKQEPIPIRERIHLELFREIIF